eukprot:9569-Heterococcus_DN1.PRE.2
MLPIQVHALQTQLATAQSKQQEAESKDLLMYIRSMPESQLRSLSEGISEEVLESMKMLVETVMRSMGGATIGRQTITQQSGQGMAQLCMWQLHWYCEAERCVLRYHLSSIFVMINAHSCADRRSLSTDARRDFTLCANRLAVGYNLREMEAREEIKKRFEAAE